MHKNRKNYKSTIDWLINLLGLGNTFGPNLTIQDNNYLIRYKEKFELQKISHKLHNILHYIFYIIKTKIQYKNNNHNNNNESTSKKRKYTM